MAELGRSENRFPPGHQAAITEETLALKRGAGLRFGDCTVLTLAAPQEAVQRAFAPPDLSNLEKIFGQGPHELDRHLFDAELRERLERLVALKSHSVDPKIEEAPLPGMLIRLSVSPTVSVLVNTGFANSQPCYTILSGNQMYRVGLEGSSLVDLIPSGNELTLKFDESVNAAYQARIPPLSKLMELQGKSGEGLRAAMPELNEHMQNHLRELTGALTKLAGFAPKLSYIGVEIPSDLKEHSSSAQDESEPRTVQVRFYRDNDCRLDSFEIVGY